MLRRVAQLFLVSEVRGKKWAFSPAILQSPSLRFLSHWNFFLGLRDASMHVLWWCATLIFCFFQPLIDQLLAHLIMKRSVALKNNYKNDNKMYAN